MPFYDYECKKCGAVKEVMHSIKDTPVIKCDKCGAECVKTISGNVRILGVGDKSTAYSKMEI